jgi:hypothetical protein
MVPHMAIHKGGAGRITKAVTQHTTCACRGKVAQSVYPGAYLIIVAVGHVTAGTCHRILMALAQGEAYRQTAATAGHRTGRPQAVQLPGTRSFLR